MTKLSVVQFGAAYGGLSTVGYTVYDEDENVVTARTTTGVSEIGTSTGIYRATITLDDGFTGYILWDTGGSPARYSAESVQPLDASQVLEVVSSSGSGLGITAGSIVSAVADATGDDSPDARAKLLRLINETGPDFCNLTDWPFLRSDLTYNITTAASKYSGASYLPVTYKRIIASYTLFNGARADLDEVGISEAYAWANPDENPGRPDQFCVTRNESGYFEIQFNRKPDQTYAVYHELELQWSDISEVDDHVLITKQFYGAYSHFVKMARMLQQGDSEQFVIAERQWYNAQTGTGKLIDAFKMLGSPGKKKGVVMSRSYIQPFLRNRGSRDYS